MLLEFVAADSRKEDAVADKRMTSVDLLCKGSSSSGYDSPREALRCFLRGLMEEEVSGLIGDKRFIRTLKEKAFWMHSFEMIEKSLQCLPEFRRLDDHQWILGQHRYLTPFKVRCSFAPASELAARIGPTRRLVNWCLYS